MNDAEPDRGIPVQNLPRWKRLREQTILHHQKQSATMTVAGRRKLERALSNVDNKYKTK
jgi:hypothetical protein